MIHVVRTPSRIVMVSRWTTSYPPGNPNRLARSSARVTRTMIVALAVCRSVSDSYDTYFVGVPACALRVLLVR
jgi:hypothetical protein